MALETLLLFALTEFLLSLTPGPAVLLVIGLSMRQGFRSGIIATTGILTTNAIFFTLSALGVGAIILASAMLFTILKWIGAAYLVYLGIGMLHPLVRRLWLRVSGGRNVNGIDEGLSLDQARQAVPRVPDSDLRAFWRGFAMQSSNPKNLAFFVAILPQFVSPDAGVGYQMIVFGMVSVLLELPILLTYAIASAISARFMRTHVIEWIEGIGGGILVGLGGALAASQRTN